MNAYKCKAVLDNGSTVEDKTIIVFANDIGKVHFIVDDCLCKSNEDYVRELTITKIDIVCGDAFVIIEE